MEKQQERKALPAHLLKQIEQCGLAAGLIQKHRESREDKNGARDVRTEVVRSRAVNDQAQLPDARAAQLWLMSIEGENVGTVRSVGGSLGLFDASTGEELASDRVDVIIDTADGEVLVASWVVGEHPFMPEPEEDLGLVAMGLAACNGKPFKVAHVYLRDGEAVCRRSPLFPVDGHQELLERIRKAAGRPRDKACYGDWCTHCRMAHHCPTWLAKAKAALVAMTNDLVLNDDGEIEARQGFELTDENAEAFAEKLELVGKIYDFGKDMRDGHVRRGGTVTLDGKVLVMSPRSGKVTVTASEFKEALEGLRKFVATVRAGDLPPTADELALFVDSFAKTIKTGNPYEVPMWQKPKTIGGRR